MIVEEPVADALAAAVASLAGRLRVGDPLDERTDVGTLIDEPAAEPLRGASTLQSQTALYS